MQTFMIQRGWVLLCLVILTFQKCHYQVYFVVLSNKLDGYLMDFILMNFILICIKFTEGPYGIHLW